MLAFPPGLKPRFILSRLWHDLSRALSKLRIAKFPVVAEGLFDGENPRLCRGGSRSLTFTGVAPFCVFPYFSQKRYMHERRPYGTPDEFLVSPTPR
jgi:hypothetical protein